MIEIDILLINNNCLSIYFKFRNDKVVKNTTHMILA